MKKYFLFVVPASLISLTGCKDKNVLCMDIGSNLKSWTVYDPQDSIIMHDQQGNTSIMVISQVKNDPAYHITERGGLMKKHAVCRNELQVMTNTNFFTMNVLSESMQSGTTRYPTSYSIHFVMDGAFSDLAVSKYNANSTEDAYAQDPYATMQNNYVSGGVTYPEVFVYERDSSSSDLNVYRFVYAKNKGLIEYSTKNPQKSWTAE